MSDADSTPWKWLFDGRYMGLVLTFTRGLTPDELLGRYGADPAAARPLPFIDIDATLQPDIDHAVLRVGVLGEWAFGIEDCGIQRAAPATLAELSRGTETISVLSGENAFQVFEYWVDGQSREQFEPAAASTLRAAGPHPFWDAAEQYRAARPGIQAILAVMRAVEDHLGARLPQETDDALAVPARAADPPDAALPRAPAAAGQSAGSRLYGPRGTGSAPGPAPPAHKWIPRPGYAPAIGWWPPGFRHRFGIDGDGGRERGWCGLGVGVTRWAWVMIWKHAAARLRYSGRVLIQTGRVAL